MESRENDACRPDLKSIIQLGIIAELFCCAQSEIKEVFLSLESEFIKDTMDFMSKYVLIVASDGEADKVGGISTTAKHWKLKLRPEGGNVVELRTGIGYKAGPDTVTAYWLPWLTKHATTLKLGAGADFFFTSEMTNCRFSILTSDEATPLVAHIAGTMSRDQRDAIEGDILKEVAKPGGWKKEKSVFEAKAVKTPVEIVKARRLSTSGAAKELHQYKGQRGTFLESGSAFVFGKRVDNKWQFYAQICAGNITPDNIKGVIPKTLERLGKMYDFPE
jgi:hypothetical protein